MMSTAFPDVYLPAEEVWLEEVLVKLHDPRALKAHLVELFNQLRLHNCHLASVIERELGGDGAQPIPYDELAWRAGPVLLVARMMGLTVAPNRHPLSTKVMQDCCSRVREMWRQPMASSEPVVQKVAGGQLRVGMYYTVGGSGYHQKLCLAQLLMQMAMPAAAVGLNA